MMPNPSVQNIFNLVIILAIGAIIYLASPMQNNVVRGILLPAHNTALPAATTVTIVKKLPAHAQYIGLIHTSYFPGDGKHDNVQAIYKENIALAKALAAKAGANVVAVQSSINYLMAGPLNRYQLTVAAAHQ